MVPTLQQPHSGGAVHSLKLTTCEDPVAKCKTSNETARTDKEKKKEAQRQAWFENTVKDELNIPTSYEEAAVTIIRWDAEIDAFRDGHDSEIKDLKDVFKQRFGFTIASEVQLNTSKKPQGALNHAITELVANHDGPNKLLIVYYTGHGMLVGPAGDQDLELTATDNVQKNSQGTYAATARWAKAETSLLDDATEADVLVILDCCFASNAHKGHTDNSRIYELLAACPKGEQTPAPGPNSFTRRLINTLKNNLEGPKDQRILTTKLVTTMNKQAKTPAKLHDRLFKEDGRHVQLTPIDKQPSKNTKQDVTPRPPELSGVKLRFSLREHELTQDKIEAWAQELLKACKTADIAIRQIDWIKMTKMEGRLARGIFRHAVKEMIRDQRRKSLTDDSLHEDTSSLGKRHLSDDSISSPAKRLAFIADLTPEAQDVSGLLTPRSNLG